MDVGCRVQEDFLVLGRARRSRHGKAREHKAAPVRQLPHGLLRDHMVVVLAPAHVLRRAPALRQRLWLRRSASGG